MWHRFRLLTFAAASLALGACGDPVAPALTARVVSVVPSGGALHYGDVNGPIVAGTWVWSADWSTLTFTPAQSLQAQTQYTLHLGGGMRATDGGFVDYGPCVGQYGGQWATQEMMGGGGRMMGGGMMGTGWRHPNGTYGMVFSFTTA